MEVCSSISILEVSHRWSLSNNQFAKLSWGIWAAKNIFNGNNLIQQWNTVLCARLWTLWLARNELIFQGISSSSSKLLLLLKIRSFRWILAFNGLHKDLEYLWNVTPNGAAMLFNKHAGGMDPIWWNLEFIGFTYSA